MKIQDWYMSLKKVAPKISWLMPNGGTILVVLILIATKSVWAKDGTTGETVANASTNTISYQGQLINSTGNPLNGTYNMVFKLYIASSGGSALWTESWTGGNAVDVTDGLFHVMLGSLNNTLSTIIENNNQLYLGITVGTDSEMQPRVQLGSSPYSIQSLTVPDNSITTAKIVDGTITSSKLDVVEANSYVVTQENTTSTTWTPLPTPDTVNITLQTSQWVDIFYGATAFGDDGAAYIALSIDGTIPPETLIETWGNVYQTIFSVHHVLLASGNHTIPLVYQTSPADPSYYCSRKLLFLSAAHIVLPNAGSTVAQVATHPCSTRRAHPRD